MQGTPRTLPPWVHSQDEDELPDLPITPDHARIAAPYLRGAHPRPDASRGRKLDHARTAEIVTISKPIAESATRWKDFMKATEPSRPSTGRTIVDERWMKNNWPYNFDDPYQHHQEPDPLAKGFWLLNPQKRRKMRKDAYRQLMNNPFVPLIFRLTVLTFSVLALALAGSLFRSTATASEDSSGGACRRLSSTYMAMSFDAVAIVYIIYITVDEYTNQPLGLRSHSAKMRLIFLDLIFIVFNSANLAIAFESLFDSTWACQAVKSKAPNSPLVVCKSASFLCHKQKALSGTLVVALVAWLVTFAISTLRIVERAVEKGRK